LFFFSTDIPRDPKGDPPLPIGETTSRNTEAGIGGAAGKGKIVEGSSPQQPVPKKRGGPRMIKNPDETQAQMNHVPNPLLRSYSCIVQIEPVDGFRRENHGALQRMWTDHGKRVRGSGKCSNEVEWECNLCWALRFWMRSYTRRTTIPVLV
jgi:hypothetical protein